MGYWELFTVEMIRVAILTVSSTRTYETDTSSKEIRSVLRSETFEILSPDIVSDDKEKIKNKLKYFSDELQADIVFTTGGTGLGPDDVTPEATLEVVQKTAPGLSELMRHEGLKKTKRAILSRGVSGIRNKTLIINLPGTPEGAKESLKAIIDLIPHAVDILKGGSH